MKKTDLRKAMLKKRASLGPACRRKYGAAITAHFFSTMFPLIKSGAIVAYVSKPKEAPTAGIVSGLRGEKRKVYAPCVTGAEISPVLMEKGCKMVKKAFGIMEPASGRKLRKYGGFAAVIVPGIAFDMRGNRLGFGGGYFDRFLKKLPKKTLKVALAFSCQVIKKVPAEKHDVKVDYVVTENGVYEV